MNPLQQFLLENPVANTRETVIVSERLKEFPFEVKAILGDEYNDYQSRCIENPNSAKKRRFNSKRFNELVVINHTVNPNFKDAEWLESAGCSMSSTALLYKVLLAGEITKLAEAILKLSGFSEGDIAEDIEEAKNS